MIKKLTNQRRSILNLLPFKPNTINKGIFNHIHALDTFLIPNEHSLSIPIRFDFSTMFKKPSKPEEYISAKEKKTRDQKVSRKPLKIRPSRKQEREQQRQNNKSFSLSITDPQLFIEHINRKNTIQDAVKLMNRILNNKNVTTQQFEQKVWKKYSYYVYVVGENQEAAWLGKSVSPQTENIQKIQFHQPDFSYQVGEQKQISHEDDKDPNEKAPKTNEFANQTLSSNNRPDNHQISRLNKRKRLGIQFLSQITQIHDRFKGKLTSQNVTKTFNKFVDHYLQRQQWSSLSFSQRISLLYSLSRYNLKKAKTLFLKKRENLFDISKSLKAIQNPSPDHKQIYDVQDVVKVVDLVVKLQIHDTALFQKCVDLLYDHVHLMKLDKLQDLTYLLGKSHKFVNKDLVIKIKERFNQLINQFSETEIIQSIHIMSSLSMIEKNMKLKSVYFEPLDIVYERIFPIFNSKLLGKLKSKYLLSLSSALRRSQYFDESVLNALMQESIKREVFQFSQSDKDGFRTSSQANRSTNEFDEGRRFSSEVISISHLTQIFFSLANFNYRDAQFINYFLNLLKVVQQSSDPEKYISYALFSRLLWSICVLCNDKEIHSLLPLMQYFYKKSKTIEPHDATNFYYCYLLLKRKYLVSEIRFQNQKIQQYILGPKHEIQISQTQRQIHKGLLDLGIPSLLEYNLNNVICDIYIPKYHDIEHLIIEVHGFHHFCRNTKRLNGSTVLKEKIIQNEGYECFYISLDEWLIAQDKKQFLKDFFQTIVAKKHAEKIKKRMLEESVKTVERVQKRGRRVLQFRKTKRQASRQIEQEKTENGLLQHNDRKKSRKEQ